MEKDQNEQFNGKIKQNWVVSPEKSISGINGANITPLRDR